MAIVLPRFSTGSIPSELKLVNTGKTKAIKKLSEVNDQVFASADVKAAADLLLTFSELGLPIPTLEPDDRIFGQLEGDSLPYKTYIAIGLSSNSLTMEANGLQKDLFCIFDEDSEYLKLKLARRDPKKTFQFEQWSETIYDSDKTTYDHVLIALTKLPGDQTLIIIGGLEAHGTERAGDFIRHHWRDEILLWSDIDSASKLSVVGNRFAAVARVSLKDDIFHRENVVVPGK